MKIALVGFGNMGKEVARLITDDSRFELISISYKTHIEKLDIDGIKKADVVIDFSSPEVVLSTIQHVASLKINLVIGTTGWYGQLETVKKIVKKNNIGLVYGQNFSIGANIFFQMVQYSAKLINKFNGYDVYGYEMHHKGKKDSPSGTARKLSTIILDNFGQKKSVDFDKINRQLSPTEFHFASIRGGRNPGFHEVIFDSTADEIRLSHGAHGRMGFAQGALLAAKFIKGKKGLYSFDSVFESEVRKK